MTYTEIRHCIDEALGRIAPDLDPLAISPDRDLVESADLDSMDFLNLITAIEEGLTVSVPERDYHRVRTLGSMVEYLDARLNGSAP